MIKVNAFATQPGTAQLFLSLPLDERKKSRLRVVADNGEELGIVLPRGQILRGGTQLIDEQGRIVEVLSANETLSVVTSNDPHKLLQAAYHLGNRHVPLQVGNGWLRYQHDHVLDAMVQGLGLSVSVDQLPFEPEDGAYNSHGSGHGSENGHHHDH